MDIEKSAVSYLEELISRNDYCVPNFSTNDKGISWDGEIIVYNQPSDNHAKNNYYSSIPVQIKGRKSTDLSKDHITYSVELTDIRNYLKKDGTIFFVIYIDELSYEKKVYYSPLLPHDLKNIITEHGNQITYNIALTTFPTNVNDMTQILLIFVSDMESQKTKLSVEDISFSKLVRDNQLNSLTFSQLPFSCNHGDITKYYFNNDFYIYANVGYGSRVTLQKITGLTEISKSSQSTIVIGDDVFSANVKVTYQRDKKIITIAKYIYIDLLNSDDIQFNIKIRGSLSERILLLNLFTRILEQKSFIIKELDGIFTLTNNEKPEKITELKTILEELYMIQNALKTLCVNDDLDLDSLDDNHVRTLSAISYSIVNDSDIGITGYDMKTSENGVFDYEFGNIRIFIYYTIKNRRIKYYDLFSVNYNASYRDNPEKESHCPFYLTLKDKDLATISNINTDKIISNLQEDRFYLEYESQINIFILSLILAYDINPEKNLYLLDLSYNLISVLRDKGTSISEAILRINELQINRRKRDLSDNEKNELINIICDNPDSQDIQLGALLLLNNQEKAKEVFSGLSEEMQTAFRTYPIFKFFEESEEYPDGQTANGNP